MPGFGDDDLLPISAKILEKIGHPIMFQDGSLSYATQLEFYTRPFWGIYG